MARASHQADRAGLDQIDSAVGFVATIFVGRGKFKKTFADSLPQAREAAIQLTACVGNGRNAIIYAILADGRQILIPSSFFKGGNN